MCACVCVCTVRTHVCRYRCRCCIESGCLTVPHCTSPLPPCATIRCLQGMTGGTIGGIVVSDLILGGWVGGWRSCVLDLGGEMDEEMRVHGRCACGRAGWGSCHAMCCSAAATATTSLQLQRFRT